MRRLSVPLLALFAVAGWGWALKLNARGDGRTSASLTSAGEPKSQRSRVPMADRSTPTKAVARLLPTNRSARLFARLELIAGSAQDGQTNRKLTTAATETLRDPDATRRSRDMVLLLDLMRPEDAVAMHEVFASLHREGLAYPAEYAAFAARWGEIDAAGALQYLGGDDPSRISARDYQNIIRGWAETDIAATMAWLDAHPELQGDHDGWRSAIGGWMTTDMDGATSALLRIEFPPGQEARVVSEMARVRLLESGIEQTATWLAGLPADGSLGGAASQAWNSILPGLEELPYDRAASVWSAVASGGWVSFGQFINYTETVSRGRSKAQGVDAFYQELSGKWSADLIRESFVRWGGADPERVQSWLGQVPPGTFATAASEGLRDTGGVAGE